VVTNVSEKIISSIFRIIIYKIREFHNAELTNQIFIVVSPSDVINKCVLHWELITLYDVREKSYSGYDYVMPYICVVYVR